MNLNKGFIVVDELGAPFYRNLRSTSVNALPALEHLSYHYTNPSLRVHRVDRELADNTFLPLGLNQLNYGEYEAAPSLWARDEEKINYLLRKVLRHPTVAGKSFLITIGDRSITGLISRDQMVGPWQVPVADNSVTISSFFSSTGEAMAIGEKTPCAIIDSQASSRMAVGEAVTNIISSGIENLSDIKLSANWMGAPDKLKGDQDLFEAVEAV